jgi:DNA-binding response OmpR family regulator
MAMRKHPSMTLKVLVVEDEPVMADIVRKGLEKADYAVDVATDGAKGLGKADLGEYVLIILDLMLPVIDGLTVCRKLRERRYVTPILMLTARDAIEDRVNGLETGADDYLPKPFHIAELQARANALIRRHRATRRRVLCVADLKIDTAGRHVTRGGKDLFLTDREYTLLEALAARPGQVFTRTFIQDSIWGREESGSNTVDVFIRLLRNKVDAGQGVKLIHTIYGEGYTLRVVPRVERR